MPSYYLSLCILALLLSIGILLRSLSQRRQLSSQAQLLSVQSESMERMQQKMELTQEDLAREGDFETDLQQATVTTELQKSRSSFVHHRNGQRPPERYQYIHKMLGAGMETEEISLTLGISCHEISQILTLSTLRSPQDADRTPGGLTTPA